MRNSRNSKPVPSEEPGPTPQQICHAWLSAYQKCVRSRDYDGAAQLFHTRVIAYGMVAPIMTELVELRHKEWEEIWRSQLHFCFQLQEASIIPTGKSFLIALPWSSESLVAGAPQKHGRATIVLMEFGGATGECTCKCVHFHMSESPPC